MLRDASDLPTDLIGLFELLLDRAQFDAARVLHNLHPEALSAATIWPRLLAHAPRRAPSPREFSRGFSVSMEPAQVEAWCLELEAHTSPPASLSWATWETGERPEDSGSKVTVTGSPLARAIELGYRELVERWASWPTPAIVLPAQTLGLASWTVRCGCLDWLPLLLEAGQPLPDRAQAWQHLQPSIPPTVALPALARIGGLPTSSEALAQGRMRLDIWAARPATAAWANQMQAALAFEVAPAFGGPIPPPLQRLMRQAIEGPKWTYDDHAELLAYPVAQWLPLRDTIEEGEWKGSRWSFPAALLWADYTHNRNGLLHMAPRWSEVHGAALTADARWPALCDEVILDGTVAGQRSPVTLRGLWALTHLDAWMDPQQRRGSHRNHLVPPHDADANWTALVSTLRQAVVRRKDHLTMTHYWAIWAQGSRETGTDLPGEVHHQLASGFRSQEPAQRVADLFSFLLLHRQPNRWPATTQILKEVAQVGLSFHDATLLRDQLLRAVLDPSAQGWGINSDLPRNGKDKLKTQRRQVLLAQVWALTQPGVTAALDEAQHKALLGATTLGVVSKAEFEHRWTAVERAYQLASQPAPAPQRPRRRI